MGLGSDNSILVERVDVLGVFYYNIGHVCSRLDSIFYVGPSTALSSHSLYVQYNPSALSPRRVQVAQWVGG